MIDAKWIEEFKNKKILIWGMGREGISSYTLIRKCCPDQKLYIAESRNASDATIEMIHTLSNIEFLYDDSIDFNSFDSILKSPGIVVGNDVPKEKITLQSTLFLKHYAKQTIGITGTKGKSTTASLLAHVLEAKYQVYLVGNIGKACFDIVENLKDTDLVVFEISCHQLEYSDYSPHVGVLLNLFQEHIDHYGTYEKYISAKENVFLHQKEHDIAIINSSLQEQIEKANNPIRAGKDIYAEGNVIHNGNETIEVKNTSLIGTHNFYNMSIVYYIAHTVYGVDEKDFLEKVGSFKTLPHRLEYFGTFDGVKYVDDSISTIGQATIKAIESLHDVTTIMIGGMDRMIDYTELEDFFIKAKDLHIICMYASGRRIFDAIHSKISDSEIYYCEDLKEAVTKAKEVSTKGMTCVLSPAAASYGYFKNFEERGEVFKDLVRTL